MDVLKPSLIRIGNRSYRLNPIGFSSDTNEDIDYLETSSVVGEYNDEYCEIDLSKIEKTNTGFKMELDVPTDCYKFIIGKKGETKKRIERETNTRITIPAPGQDGLVGEFCY